MVLLDFHPTQGFMIGTAFVTYSVYVYGAYPIKESSTTTKTLVESGPNNSRNNNNNDSESMRTKNSDKHDDDDDTNSSATDSLIQKEIEVSQDAPNRI